ESSAVVASVTIDLADLTSSYQLFGVVLQLDTTSDFTANKWLKFSTAATLSATNNIILDKIMMVRGKAFAAFSPRTTNFEGDSTNPGTSENINLGTINNVAAPDLGNPTGSQGGGFGPGTGGRVTPSTLA